MNSEKSNPRQKSLTYAQSGVDISRATLAKEQIANLARSTFNSAVLSEIGSFGGLYAPDFKGQQNPVLVASADGVGTKLKIAFQTGVHSTVGQDLVAHCTNDIVVQGALPLFFLDYIATGKLEASTVAQIVAGLAQGCTDSGCALLGGETAEMPEFYQDGEYDLAGFIVGWVEREKILSSHRVLKGDRLIGLASSGLHTNGFSLVREVFFKRKGWGVEKQIPSLKKTLGEELLTPHRNYLECVKPLLSDSGLHALAHVTGGGIGKNLDRSLPHNLDARVTVNWEVPAIFQLIQEMGPVDSQEMFDTFNMGIGMILVTDSSGTDRIFRALEDQGERPIHLGEIIQGAGKVRLEG